MNKPGYVPSTCCATSKAAATSIFDLVEASRRRTRSASSPAATGQPAHRARARLEGASSCKAA
eukprot:15121544-Heterocapsa_arctica.AAC.1